MYSLFENLYRLYHRNQPSKLPIVKFKKAGANYRVVQYSYIHDIYYLWNEVVFVFWKST